MIKLKIENFSKYCRRFILIAYNNNNKTLLRYVCLINFIKDFEKKEQSHFWQSTMISGGAHRYLEGAHGSLV